MPSERSPLIALTLTIIVLCVLALTASVMINPPGSLLTGIEPAAYAADRLDIARSKIDPNWAGTRR